MTARAARAGLAALVLMATGAACGTEPPSDPRHSKPVSDGRYSMGTVLEIWLYGLEPEPARALLDRLFARAAELERVLSRQDPESELSRLNQAGGGRQPVHPDLARVLEQAIAQAKLTQGSFDVTIGPLLELWWGAAERGRAPDEAEIRAARARIGAGRMRAGTDAHGAGFAELEPGMSVDLGGIAKGYTLDRLAELARLGGAQAALLSFGQSSLHALGAPPGEPGFRVLVRDADGGFSGTTTLRDQSLSISGSLGQGFEIAGVHYGHVVDPRSGRPLTRSAVAAVLARSGSRAEALSKALLLLLPDEGMGLLETLPGADGMVIVRGLSSGQGYRASCDCAFSHP